MFNLYTANDAAKLAGRLSERLRAQLRGRPLAQTLILVPQAGLRRWLQVSLAQKLGVIANVEFRAPAEFAWDLLRAARPDLPRRSPFEPDVLRWHIHALLGGELDGAALAPLREYLAGGGDPLRRYALATELAHVFERMQGYRRQRLLGWERGADASGWQAELWRRLVARIGGGSRAARVEDWLRRFDPASSTDAVLADKPAPPGLPAHVHAFACANISPDVLRMLGVAAHHCELDFHLPLPSREYLGDAPRSRREIRKRLVEKDSGNPLIVSLGGAAAEFIELLYSYEYAQPDTEADLFDEHMARKTLLGRVRDDILNHQAAREEDRAALPDDSLQFHACHTPLREVQTLHDALLAMFAATPALTPRDIAVMTPDVAAYRPAIDAVFGGLPESDSRFIPFNLGDLPASAAHPAAQLFLTLLDAPTSRWELREIVDVLGVPGVMRRFDLDASSLEQLARRLREAGVRWGEDERARAQTGGYREFSFAFGLDRMLAGFACGDDEDALVAGVAPLAGMEGAAFARMDALLALLEVWRELRALAARKWTSVQWQEKLNALFDGLYANDPDDLAESRALERVRGALEELVEHTQAAQLDQPIAWHDVCAYLRERLNDADPRQLLFSGGVTFCGMVPLRVVPFRVICLLGMDETAFPRRDPDRLDPLLADRRAGRSERGDRNVRDDDRLLFLQLLATARDTFYVSWVGRDAHSNEVLAPSVVVAELMDNISRDYLLTAGDDTAREAQNALLPRVQPLHPFDPRLFGMKGRPRSYRREWQPAVITPDAATLSAPFATGVLQLQTSQPSELSLEELRRFLLDPARGFLEHGLGITLPYTPRDDGDDEPLAPGNGLTRWNLTRALLEYGEGNASATRDILRARGQLPPGALGDEALRDAHLGANALRAAATAFTGGAAPSPVETLYVILDDDTRLHGAPADLYPGGVLHVRPGVIDGRHVLRAWLDALVCAAAGTGKPVMLTGLTGSGVCSFALPQLGKFEAREQLRELVALYREGARAPLPFFVRTSWDHALTCASAESQAAAPVPEMDFHVFQKAASSAESDNGFGGHNELGSDAVCIAWRGRELPGPGDGVLAKRLHEIALTVFAQPARAWAEQFK